MSFEWDDKKNETNLEQHGVSFETAAHVFADEKLIVIADDKHSQQEDRYFAIGKVNQEVLTVRFTKRDDNIRIFGAGYWRSGRKRYEEQT